MCTVLHYLFVISSLYDDILCSLIIKTMQYDNCYVISGLIMLRYDYFLCFLINNHLTRKVVIEYCETFFTHGQTVWSFDIYIFFFTRLYRLQWYGYAYRYCYYDNCFYGYYLCTINNGVYSVLREEVNMR